MPVKPMGEPSWRIGPKIAGLFLVLVATLCWSAPRTPVDVNEVLERLVVKAADPSTALLRGYQKAVSNAPADVRAVGDLARLYFDLAGESGDPRYVGYAEALINRYPVALPAELLFVRGLLRQYRHAFAEAQQDFSAVLASKPDFLEAQGWRGAIFLVQADYANAKLACDALGAAGAPTLQAGCLGLTLAYTGQLAPAYRELERGLALAGNPSNRLWLLTRLAEVAAWQGRAALAEKHYRSALSLGISDAYLLAAWSDFLLDQGRPLEVIRELTGREASDPLLLRLALAHQQNASSKTPVLEKMLEERFAATRMRGDTTHRAEEARYTLMLRRDVSSALVLAQANFEVQREPRDARIVLEAALAAGDPAAAKKVQSWLQSSGFQGAPLSQQMQALEALPKGKP